MSKVGAIRKARALLGQAHSKGPVGHAGSPKLRPIDMAKLKRTMGKKMYNYFQAQVEDKTNKARDQKAKKARASVGNTKEESQAIMQEFDNIIQGKMQSLATSIQTEARGRILNAGRYGHRDAHLDNLVNSFFCDSFAGTEFHSDASKTMTPNRPRVYGVNIGIISSMERVVTRFPDSTASGGFAQWKRSMDSRKYKIPFWQIVEFGTLKKFQFHETSFSPLMLRWTTDTKGADVHKFPNRVLSAISKHKATSKYVVNKPLVKWKTKKGKVRTREFKPNSFMVYAKKTSRRKDNEGIPGIHIIYKMQTKYKDKPSREISKTANAIIKREIARAIKEMNSFVGNG